MHTPIQFPKPLEPGDRIAVSAFSSGVPLQWQARLALAVSNLQARGFEVWEGQTVRGQWRGASAPAAVRAAELEALLLDPGVAAVIPPWGGELASDVLEWLDWDALRAAPAKWVVGFSDVSTLQLPLLLKAGWASVHGPNLMQWVPAQQDPLTSALWPLLAGQLPLSLPSSARHERAAADACLNPDAPFQLTEPGSPRWLNADGRASVTVRGRCLGGCLDALVSLQGTPWGDVPGFVRRHREEGVILMLESAELSPPALQRALLGLRRAGWFEGVAGVVMGRLPQGPLLARSPDDSPAALLYDDVLQDCLGVLPCPVWVEADVGHVAPQWPWRQGGLAWCHWDGAGLTMVQEAG